MEAEYNDGQPCQHRGCLNHISHPCEGCGRIRGKGDTMKNLWELSIMTFDAFIEYGKEQHADIVDGMPWSFDFFGHQVTRENDKCYLISIGSKFHYFTPAELVCIENEKGIYFIDSEKYYDVFKKPKSYSIESVSDFYRVRNGYHVGNIAFESGEWRFRPAQNYYDVWDLEEIVKIIKRLPIDGKIEQEEIP